MVVQAITGLDGNSYTRQQAQAVTQRGLRLGAYFWCFPGSSVLSRVTMFDGFIIDNLWLDVEQQGLRTSDVQRDLDICDGYFSTSAPMLTGIYSGKWFWDQMGWGSLWSNRPLWDSNYDHLADRAADFRPYGGWTSCAMKQYAGTSSIGRLHQIDLDVI